MEVRCMTDMIALMKARHSVRQYENRPIPEDVRVQLDGDRIFTFPKTMF